MFERLKLNFNLMKYFIYFLIIAFSVSCSSTKSVRFTQKKNDIFTNENLKTFLASHKNPKVVLRVPFVSRDVTEQDDNSYLYNAIENELLSNGFIVRDRQLFNQIIANSENNVDYEVLKQKSDTDLIIELSQLKRDILYETNKYYDQNGREKVESVIKYEYFGALVEFKVIIVENNEYAGTYRFNYTPCTDPCVVSISQRDYEKMQKEKKKNKPVGYEGVADNEMEIFIRDATKKLVQQMRM